MCVFLSVLFIILTEAKKYTLPKMAQNPALFNSRNIDVFSQNSEGPVPFGHIFKKGFGDPNSGLKPPVDMLELIMRAPANRFEAMQLLKNKKPEEIELIMKPKANFVNPRDKLLKELGLLDLAPLVNETKLKWYDLVAIQAKNVENPPSPKLRSMPRLPESGNVPKRRLEISKKTLPEKERKYFMNNRYALQATTNQNFTLCEDFASKAYFYPKDIIGFDWVPFYIWSLEDRSLAVVHKFSYATKKLIKKYREYYSPIYKSIDWELPKMLLRGYSEFLLVAENRHGLFHALSLPEIPLKIKDITLPYAKLLLKIAEPYLAMMYCDDFFATIMVVAGNEPSTDKDKEAEAAIIKFKGKGQPVSRDFIEEQRQLKAKKEMELEMKDRASISINEPIPPMY